MFLGLLSVKGASVRLFPFFPPRQLNSVIFEVSLLLSTPIDGNAVG